MFLSRKRLEDKNEDDRQLVIAFKRFFNTDEGKLIFSTLANKYYLLNDFPDTLTDTQLARRVGQSSVIKFILTQSKTNMADFDRILEGNKHGG